MVEAKNLIDALTEVWPSGKDPVFQGPAFAGCNTNANKICWFDMLGNFSALSDDIKFISFHRHAAWIRETQGHFFTVWFAMQQLPCLAS
jgi:hypothetical protein